MNRNYADSHYSTLQTQDRKQGFSGLELYRTRNGKTDRIAAVIFWDASGQFFVETFDSDVPLEILEDLIRETKEVVKVG
jgi:heme-degrading monooxygenase HmoA